MFATLYKDRMYNESRERLSCELCGKFCIVPYSHFFVLEISGCPVVSCAHCAKVFGERGENGGQLELFAAVSARNKNERENHYGYASAS